jgi:polyhydroxyalkanoate synthesis repressor PhaR
MTDIRVIKKYPNRRLYDTEESRYIRLADVRDLVLGDVAFVVVDKKTGDDITRDILLQVIAEEERQREPVMSRAFLAQVIRAHRQVAAPALSAYLEHCLDAYLRRGSSVVPVHRGRWATALEDAPRRPADEPEDALMRANANCVEDRKRAG